MHDEINTNTIYQNLRDEIMYNIKKQDTYTTTAYTLAISIWTITLTISNEWITLISLIVLVPMSLLVCDCRYSIAFISTYMAIFLEKSQTVGWEYVREIYYNENKRKFSDKIIYLCSKFGFWILSAVSCVMFWSIRGFNFNILNSKIFGIVILIIQIAIVLFQMCMCSKYSDISKLKKPLLTQWEKIYDITIIQMHAAGRGESTNEFINRAINETMERDTSNE